MIPKVTKSGHSFKGAAAYYLNDKTQDNDFNQAAGAKSKTAERVEWTETRNLATDNPDTAWKIMAATALDGERLKANQREAEGKRAQASGQQNGKSVYAYSLAWSPDEKGTITRDDMTAAANDTLEKLGFKDHQALIVAHNDTDHPHVHVIVNKVNPQTGKMHNPNRDYNQLDKWAREYRKGRGEEHLTPNREKKWQNHDEGISNKNRNKQSNTQLSGDQNKALHSKHPDAAEVRRKLASRNNLVSEIGKRQTKRHGQQWADFKKSNATAKNDIYNRYDKIRVDTKNQLNDAKSSYAKMKDQADIKLERKLDKIKAKYKPVNTANSKQAWKDRRAYEAREQTLSGRLGNSITAAFVARKLAPANSEKGLVKNTISMFFNTDKRAKAFDDLQKAKKDEAIKPMFKEMNAARAASRAELKFNSASIKDTMADCVSTLKNLNMHRSGELQAHKAACNTGFKTIKDAQGADRKKLQRIWAKLKKQRNAKLKALKDGLAKKAQTETKNRKDFYEANQQAQQTKRATAKKEEKKAEAQTINKKAFEKAAEDEERKDKKQSKKQEKAADIKKAVARKRNRTKQRKRGRSQRLDKS